MPAALSQRLYGVLLGIAKTLCGPLHSKTISVPGATSMTLELQSSLKHCRERAAVLGQASPSEAWQRRRAPVGCALRWAREGPRGVGGRGARSSSR